MDLYCPLKFEELQVHVQSRLLYNCCMAFPERCDLDWLEANPGKIFHTPTMIEDRKKMMQNISFKSCAHGCFNREKLGLPSHREKQFYSENKHTDAQLRTLKLSLSNDCNMSCLYCAPEWSTGWQKQLEKSGPIKLDGLTIENTKWNKIWKKVKQKNRSLESKFFKLLTREINHSSSIEKIVLLGGEPLLVNNIEKFIQQINDQTEIHIHTGLGLKDSRLKKFLGALKNKKLFFNLSVDSTNEHYDLIRRGNTWENFLNNYKILKQNKVNITLQSVMTNLSIFGLENFVNFFKNEKIVAGVLTERDFLMPNVVDEKTKNLFYTIFQNYKDNEIFKLYEKHMRIEPSAVQVKNLKTFIKKYESNKIQILPKHFLDWVDYHN